MSPHKSPRSSSSRRLPGDTHAYVMSVEVVEKREKLVRQKELDLEEARNAFQREVEERERKNRLWRENELNSLREREKQLLARFETEQVERMERERSRLLQFEAEKSEWERERAKKEEELRRRDFEAKVFRDKTDAESREVAQKLAIEKESLKRQWKEKERVWREQVAQEDEEREKDLRQRYEAALSLKAEAERQSEANEKRRQRLKQEKKELRTMFEKRTNSLESRSRDLQDRERVLTQEVTSQLQQLEDRERQYEEKSKKFMEEMKECQLQIHRQSYLYKHESAVSVSEFHGDIEEAMRQVEDRRKKMRAEEEELLDLKTKLHMRQTQIEQDIQRVEKEQRALSKKQEAMEVARMQIRARDTELTHREHVIKAEREKLQEAVRKEKAWMYNMRQTLDGERETLTRERERYMHASQGIEAMESEREELRHEIRKLGLQKKEAESQVEVLGAVSVFISFHLLCVFCLSFVLCTSLLCVSHFLFLFLSPSLPLCFSSRCIPLYSVSSFHMSLSILTPTLFLSLILSLSPPQAIDEMQKKLKQRESEVSSMEATARQVAAHLRTLNDMRQAKEELAQLKASMSVFTEQKTRGLFRHYFFRFSLFSLSPSLSLPSFFPFLTRTPTRTPIQTFMNEKTYAPRSDAWTTN